jgi:hypothetical protein
MTELAFWFLIFALIYVLADWGSTCIFGGKSSWGIIEGNGLWRRLGVFGSLIVGLVFVSGLSFILDTVLVYLYGFAVITSEFQAITITTEVPLIIGFAIWSVQIAHNLVVGYQDSR